MVTDQEILSLLGYPEASLLGRGSEARVYGLDSARVARIHRDGASLAQAHWRQSLLACIEAQGHALPFATPVVQQIDLIDDRIVSLERRLTGVNMHEAMTLATGARRDDLLMAFLNGALALAALPAEPFLALNLPQMAAPFLKTTARTGLVHLDYAFGNVLMVDDRLAAVIDFGPTSMIGDVRFTLWCAVAYLDPELSPSAGDADRALALRWLEQNGVLEGYAEAKRWLAQYWAFATDDQKLMDWCARVKAG